MTGKPTLCWLSHRLPTDEQWCTTKHSPVLGVTHHSHHPPSAAVLKGQIISNLTSIAVNPFEARPLR